MPLIRNSFDIYLSIKPDILTWFNSSWIGQWVLKYKWRCTYMHVFFRINIKNDKTLNFIQKVLKYNFWGRECFGVLVVWMFLNGGEIFSNFQFFCLLHCHEFKIVFPYEKLVKCLCYFPYANFSKKTINSPIQWTLRHN